MKVLLFGMNHRTAPIELRERFAVDQTGPLLRKLMADYAATGLPPAYIPKEES